MTGIKQGDTVKVVGTALVVGAVQTLVGFADLNNTEAWLNTAELEFVKPPFKVGDVVADLSDLDELPLDTIIREDDGGFALRKSSVNPGLWFRDGEDGHLRGSVAFPATILYLPKDSE